MNLANTDESRGVIVIVKKYALVPKYGSVQHILMEATIFTELYSVSFFLFSQNKYYHMSLGSIDLLWKDNSGKASFGEHGTQSKCNVYNIVLHI